MEYTTLKSLLELSTTDRNFLTIGATVASGLEKIAQRECYEMFGKNVPILLERGHVYFNISRDVLHNVFLMRSIDNVYIIVYVKKFNFVSEKKENLMTVLNCYSEIDWKKPVSVWQEVYQYFGTLYPTKEEYESNKKIYDALNEGNPKKCKIAKEKSNKNKHVINKEVIIEKVAGDKRQDEESQESINEDNTNVDEKQNYQGRNTLSEDDAIPLDAEVTIPKFRVSARRVGSHSYTSEDIAKSYGAMIQEDFLWIVDLTDFDMEIMANMSYSDFIISISLTKSSLHRRNLSFFGLTSLRATICYSLIKLAMPQIGDIVIDPLAGSGSIPIEGAIAFPKSYFLAADFQDVACGLCKKNLDSYDLKTKLPLDILKWDSVKLPIRNSSVDIIVTDMPFGKRSGSKKSNRALYPGVLREFGRVLRKGSGRAVLLTADRRSLEMACFLTKQLWKLKSRRHVNIGGIKAVVFLMIRI